MDKLKDFYTNYEDNIFEKRFRSNSPIRRYAHESQYESVLSYVKPGMKVLDAGCGEGVLSVMMAKKGALVSGSDISEPNIEACKKYAETHNVDINFCVADSEKLPFGDGEFDLVVSSHVLEHLPDFDKGLEELMRVTKKRAVAAIPTLPNLCSITQVGRGFYWIKRPKSIAKFFVGLIKTFFACIFFQDGVNETYAGQGVPHIFRFPWVMKRKSKKLGFKVVEYEASTICIPYFESLLPLVKFLDKYKNKKFFRNFGYGTTYVIEKN